MHRKSKYKTNSSLKKPFFKSDGLSPKRLKCLKKETNKSLRSLDSEYEIPFGKTYKLQVKSCWFIRHASPVNVYLGGPRVKK